MKLAETAKKVEDSLLEALTYMSFPSEHWLRIRTNNTIERLNREIRRRTRFVGSFPDGKSALMLVCKAKACGWHARGSKRYMNMDHLSKMIEESEAIYSLAASLDSRGVGDESDHSYELEKILLVGWQGIPQVSKLSLLRRRLAP